MVGMAFMPRPDLKCVMIQNVSIPIVLPEMQIGDFSECQKSIDLLFHMSNLIFKEDRKL